MGKISYSDLKNVIKYNVTSNNKGYELPLMPKLNRTIGNVSQGQIHTVSGLPSSGVTSFIDQNYVMSILLQWYNTRPAERYPLKILYYSMKDSELKKLQLLLCNYLKLVDGLRTDVPTLNSQIGKLYDIEGDKNLNIAINRASTFFDEVIDDEVLVIKDGQYKPTDIYNDVINYMDTIGSKNSKKEYEADSAYENQLVLVVVDPTEYLVADNDGFGTITGSTLIEKFQQQIMELKTIYNVSFVLAIPSVTGYIRTPKDTEPHYRHLGTYGLIADKGICIYNSLIEGNMKFYDGNASLYTSPKGNILMRTWHVVRNTDGIESIHGRMFFLPGTSYMIEHDYNNKIDDLDDVLEILEQDTVFND